MTDKIVLHGDLHHDNILSAKRHPWLAIDPKGVIGEPAYETGALLRNPLLILLKQDNPKQILEKRIYILSEQLGFDRKRIHGWALSQAVLSAWWNIEDNVGRLDNLLRCAELLDELKI